MKREDGQKNVEADVVAAAAVLTVTVRGSGFWNTPRSESVSKETPKNFFRHYLNWDI